MGMLSPLFPSCIFKVRRRGGLGKRKASPSRALQGKTTSHLSPVGTQHRWVAARGLHRPCGPHREGKLGKPCRAGSISSFLLSLQIQLESCWLCDLAGGEPRWCESSTLGKLVSIQGSKTCRQSEGKQGLPEPWLKLVEAVKPSPPPSHTEPEFFMSE